MGSYLRQGADYRQQAAKWYKSKQWQQLRRQQLDNQPYCQCLIHKGQDRSAIATVVDHIKPHRGNKRLFFDARNLQSMTKQCHDSIKQQQEKSGYVKGSDEHGNPIDPTAEWW